MSSSLAVLAPLLFFVFHLLSPPTLRIISTAKVVIAARPLMESIPPSYQSLKPKEGHGLHGFGSKDVENCLPKGIHRTSAPSRYVNYHILGSSPSLCDSSKRMTKP